MLSEILRKKREEVERQKKEVSQQMLLQEIEKLSPPRSFLKNLTKKRHSMHLIAEIKKASPSAGVLRENFQPVEIAEIYQHSGADAISVLTDESFFQGRLSDIKEVKQRVRLPVLRKDFIFDSYQIYESRAAESDALLLIAELLSKDELSRFLTLIHSLGMEALVEIHTKEDLDKALDADVPVIGINQRNLHTFKIHREVVDQLIPAIPKKKIVVCESGIRSREDIIYLKTLGVSAVLIGEAFMRSPDIAAKIKELFSAKGGSASGGE